MTPEFPPFEPYLDDVERELIRADIAYLIELERKSGDWAKWQESQNQLPRLRYAKLIFGFLIIFDCVLFVLFLIVAARLLWRH